MPHHLKPGDVLIACNQALYFSNWVGHYSVQPGETVTIIDVWMTNPDLAVPRASADDEVSIKALLPAGQVATNSEFLDVWPDRWQRV